MVRVSSATPFIQTLHSMIECTATGASLTFLSTQAAFHERGLCWGAHYCCCFVVVSCRAYAHIKTCKYATCRNMHFKMVHAVCMQLPVTGCWAIVGMRHNAMQGFISAGIWPACTADDVIKGRLEIRAFRCRGDALWSLGHAESRVNGRFGIEGQEGALRVAHGCTHT